MEEIFNYNNFSNETTEASPYSAISSISVKIITGIVLSSIIVGTLVGNLLVATAILKFRKMRTSTNFLILSLAVADIAVAVFVMPIALMYEITETWTFGVVFCRFWRSLDVMCCTASILNLGIISLDRYCAILNPLRYKSKMSKRRILIMIASVWICSSLISFIPICLGWHLDQADSVNNADPFICELEVNRTYAAISSLISFYLPLSVILFTYKRIYSVAKLQAKRVQNDLTRLKSGDPAKHLIAFKKRKNIVKEQKAIRTLGIVVGAFFFGWAPFFAAYLILPFCKTTCQVPETVLDIFLWCGYFNSMANPCIYGLLNKDFKLSFHRIICCESRYGGNQSREEETTNQLPSSLKIDRI